MAVVMAMTACGSTVAGSATSTASGAALNPDQSVAGASTPKVPVGSPVSAAAPDGPAGPSTANPAAVPGAATGPGSSSIGNPGAGNSKHLAPIEVGIFGIRYSQSTVAAQTALGAKTPQASLGANDVARALISSYNNHGGIAGRRIIPIEYDADISGDYQTQTQAACASFTQDHHVAAVVSATGDFFTENFASCLHKAAVPYLEAANNAGDRQSFADYPNLVTPGAPSVDRRVLAMVNGLARARFLTAKNKLGVIVEDCPFNKRAYNGTLAPLAQRLGVRLYRRDINCLQGYSDAGNLAAQVQSAVLPYQTDGVDRVMFVSGWETAATLFFENQASSQGYRPSYAVSSLFQGAGWSSNFSADALSRIRGVGWAPDGDVNTAPPASAATRRCNALLRSEGIDVASSSDRQTSDEECNLFFLLESALRSVGTGDVRAGLIGAIEALGSVFQSPYNLSGRTEFSHARHDGAHLFATFSYGAGCGCFRYDSRPSPLA